MFQCSYYILYNNTTNTEFLLLILYFPITLLSGDACHVMVPIGGFGMNTGVLDAYDLGWKLVATINGWGGERLLATYTVRHGRTGIAVDECSNF